MRPRIHPKAMSRLWKMAWPTVIYSIMEITVGLVDIFFAGFLNAEAVAAIGFCRQIFLVMMIGTLAITTGTITLIAQYYGAKRYERASAVAFHALLLSLAAGLVFGMVGVYTAKPALQLLRAEDLVLRYGTDYLHVLMGGVVFMLINFSTNAVFRALGDTKTPLKIALFINGFNAAFDYLFLFGFWIVPPLAVMEIAVGTILARAIGAMVSLWILLDRRRTVRIRIDTRLEPLLVQNLLQVGLPSGIAGFVRNGARLVFLGLIASTGAGTAAVAAAAIGFQIRLLVIMPALAFQVAASALVGQSLGAEKIQEAEEMGWTTILFCSAATAALSLGLALFPLPILRLFSDHADVLGWGGLTLRFIALEQFCSSVAIVASGALSGAGDTKPSMQYTMISQGLVLIPLAWVLEQMITPDVLGAWMAWGMAPMALMVLTVRRFMGGRWKTMRV